MQEKEKLTSQATILRATIWEQACDSYNLALARIIERNSLENQSYTLSLLAWVRSGRTEPSPPALQGHTFADVTESEDAIFYLGHETSDHHILDFRNSFFQRHADFLRGSITFDFRDLDTNGQVEAYSDAYSREDALYRQRITEFQRITSEFNSECRRAGPVRNASPETPGSAAPS